MAGLPVCQYSRSADTGEITQPQSAEDSRELYTKEMRVRATKTDQMITNPAVPITLTIVLVACVPVERLTYHIFKEQADECWKSKDPEKFPLVNLANVQESAACKAMDQLCRMLQSASAADAMPILQGKL